MDEPNSVSSSFADLISRTSGDPIMAELSTRFAHAPGGRVLAALVAVALGSASIGVSSVAFAQPKPATGGAAKPATGGAKPAAGAAKPAAGAAAKGPTAADKKKAGEHFKKGKDLFDKKDFKGAKDEFSKAEELVPAGAAEYYIARCQEENGDAADAASWYDKAISSGKLKPELESDAKTREAALKTKPAKVKVTSDPPGATILVDGKDSGMKTPADVDVAPGSHKITLQAPGKKDSDQTVEVAAFTGATVNATLEAGAAEDPFATKDTGTTATTGTTTTPPDNTATATATVTPGGGGGKRDMTWVYVTGAAAIVGLGVGTFFGIKALGDKKDFDDATSSTAPDAGQNARDIRDRGTRDALISDMGFGIGITLAVTSAVLYFSGGSSGSSDSAAPAAAKKPTVAFAPIVSGIGSGSGPSMAGASAAFTF
jgi:serine/threonine-protein kinase